MASNLLVNGTDLDSILKARVGGDPTAATVGIMVGGVDISQRYYPSTVSPYDNTAGVTGFKRSGVDISGAFRAATFNPTITVTLDHYTATATGAGNGPLNTERVLNTAVSGGATASGYSRHWEYVDGDGTLTPNDSNIFNPYFIGSGTAPQVKTGRWACKITDVAGLVGFSSPVTITVTMTAVNPSVGLSTTSVSGSGSAPGSGITSSVTATASGGSGTGYTYSWTRVSGDSATSATASTSATTAFLHGGSSAGTFASVWHCTVTDSLGNSGVSGNVSASITLT